MEVKHILRLYCLSAMVVSTSKSRKSTAKNFAVNNKAVRSQARNRLDFLLLCKFFRLVVDFAEERNIQSSLFRLLLVLFFVLPKGNINPEVKTQ